MQTEISKCCKAQVKIGGDEGDGTHYYICSKCNNPCDLHHEEEIEISKMSDLELTNYFVNKAVPNTRVLTEEERTYREEILLRLSKNRVDKKEFEENDVLLAQYFGKNIEYKEKVIGEFKKKLVEEIKQYNIDVKNTSKMLSENMIEDLINNVGKEK